MKTFQLINTEDTGLTLHEQREYEELINSMNSADQSFIPPERFVDILDVFAQMKNPPTLSDVYAFRIATGLFEGYRYEVAQLAEKVLVSLLSRPDTQINHNEQNIKTAFRIAQLFWRQELDIFGEYAKWVRAKEKSFGNQIDRGKKKAEYDESFDDEVARGNVKPPPEEEEPEIRGEDEPDAGPVPPEIPPATIPGEAEE